MPKFKIDLNKGLYDQPYWNLLKPEAKLMAIESWKAANEKLDKLIATGEVVIDPNIQEQRMSVKIPTNQLTKEKI